MDVKCLELRDAGTFIPVICIRPVPDNDAQRYLLRRDGYVGDVVDVQFILGETDKPKQSERITSYVSQT